MKSVKFPKYLLVVLAMTVVNLLILAIRNYIVGDSVFDFLKSNLFSGFVPLIVAVLLSVFYSKINNLVFILGSLLWLLFYPNSPYMISDLIHDSEDAKDAIIPDLIVFDTLIIFSIAMLSVFYGFISLKIMFKLFLDRFGSKFAHTAITLSLLLSCLGFYMGRVIASSTHAGNLYSWDFFLHPGLVLKQVWDALFPVGEHLPAYYMMILFGIIQYMLLVMMKDVNDIEGSELITK